MLTRLSVMIRFCFLIISHAIYLPHDPTLRVGQKIDADIFALFVEARNQCQGSRVFLVLNHSGSEAVRHCQLLMPEVAQFWPFNFENNWKFQCCGVNMQQTAIRLKST